jgi:hypothetical protein
LSWQRASASVPGPAAVVANCTHQAVTSWPAIPWPGGRSPGPRPLLSGPWLPPAGPQDADNILANADTEDIAFLVVGDPFG